jgi:transcriptional regulator with XRE-family HTH domain
MATLQNNIKIIRGLSGQTQKDFIGNFTGVTVAMQKSYEAGIAKPDILYLQELSDMSGVPMEDLQKKPLTKADITISKKKGELVGKEDPATPENFNSLVRTLENLTRDKEKTTAILERLTEDKKNTTDIIMRLLLVIERQINSAQSGKAVGGLHVSSAEGDDPAFEDLQLGRNPNRDKNNPF